MTTFNKIGLYIHIYFFGGWVPFHCQSLKITIKSTLFKVPVIIGAIFTLGFMIYLLEFIIHMYYLLYYPCMTTYALKRH